MLPSSKIQLILINPKTIHHLLHILHTVARILIGDKSRGSYPRDQFTIFIKDRDVGAECILSKFTDDTKLGRVVDVPKRCADIQTDLSRVEKWAEGNLVKINKGKCKALHLKKEEPQTLVHFRAAQLESSSAKKDLWMHAGGTAQQRCASKVSLQQRLTVFRAALVRVLPAG